MCSWNKKTRNPLTPLEFRQQNNLIGNVSAKRKLVTLKQYFRYDFPYNKICCVLQHTLKKTVMFVIYMEAGYGYFFTPSFNMACWGSPTLLIASDDIVVVCGNSPGHSLLTPHCSSFMVSLRNPGNHGFSVNSMCIDLRLCGHSLCFARGTGRAVCTVKGIEREEEMSEKQIGKERHGSA